MDIRRTRIFSVTTAAIFAAATLASAQAPASSTPQTRPDAPAADDRQDDARADSPRMHVSPIEGELMDVDADAKTFVIMTDEATGATAGVSTGPEARIEFTYTDDTTVDGVEQGVAGLAARRATRMTVHFTEEDGKKIANRIELTPASGPDSAPGAPSNEPR